MSHRIKIFKITTALLVLGACTDSADLRHSQRAEQAWNAPVPPAQCGAQDPVETGLQGQVSLSDRATGRSLQGYACNLERVGQFAGEGTSWQMAWFEDCAYYDTARLVPTNAAGSLPERDTLNSLPRPGQLFPGTTVLNVADPRNPVATDYLTTPAMLDPWESLKVNEPTQLLAAVQDGGGWLDVYSVAGDCQHPELKASINVPGVQGHEGNFAVDGRTYYISERSVNNYCPMDVTDPEDPELIMCWPNPGTTHGVSTNPDGTRGYFSNASGNGLLIGDTGEIQARSLNPDIQIVSEFYWPDGAQAQQTLHIMINAAPFVLFVDESGKGAARLIDIGDEDNPRLASRLMLEVHDPANADAVALDTTDGTLFGYEGHYCNVDDPNDARIVICSYFQSGLRVFDVRDPYRPREIAYFNPPARPGYQAGSNYNLSGLCGSADWTTASARYRADRDEIWFTSQCNGFQVLRFTTALKTLMSGD